MNKTCTKCNDTKSLECFSKSYKTKSGEQRYSSTCKTCFKEYSKSHYKNNRKAYLERAKSWVEENKDKRLEYDRQYHYENRQRRNSQRKENYRNNLEREKEAVKRWRENNLEKSRAIKRKWAKDNPEYSNHMANLRRARKLQATPDWLTDNHINQIKHIYKEAVRITEETGIKHHVDHIHPLKGETVCGLHVPWNLQVITAEENMKKGNKLSTD